MLTAHSECFHTAAALVGHNRLLRRRAVPPFPRLPAPAPFISTPHAAHSPLTGRQHGAGASGAGLVPCQAAANPPQRLTQDDRRKSERSKVRRRNRPQPPPPLLFDPSIYDNDKSTPAAEQESVEPRDEEGGMRYSVDASTSSAGELSGQESGAPLLGPASTVAASASAEARQQEATRPTAAEMEREEPLMDAPHEGEEVRESTLPGASTATEMDVEVVRGLSADVFQDAQFTDVAADPVEAALQQRQRQQVAKEAAAQLQAKERLNRKAGILLEILNAGTGLEAKIREHRDEIDELMLQMLLKRIEASQRLGESEALVESLALLWQRLRSEATRIAASPAERLMDEALEILGSRSQLEYASRKKEVAERLEAAFTVPGSQPVNIFSMATVLAAGGTVESEAAAREHVPRSSFLEEAELLLDEALARSAELQALLDSKNLEKEDSDAVTSELRFRGEALNYLKVVLSIAIALPA